MSRTSLKRQAKNFLQSLAGKSPKTVATYEEGLEPLLFFFENYYESDDGQRLRIVDIRPEDIDYILSYFVIRKYMAGTTFRLNSAKSIAAFFRYLVADYAYDKTDASEIQAMAKYYRAQYPRLDRLESSLWDATEGEIDRLMKLPKKEREAKRAELQASMQGSTMRDAGYVNVTKIDGSLVYGTLLEDDTNTIGPVLIDPVSQGLIRVGDIINMISLMKKKDTAQWEIAELGYVYPRPYGDLRS